MILAEQIARYAHSLEFGSLPPEVLDCVKVRMIDSLATALGAYDARPAEIARRLAATVPVTSGATVLGTDQRTTPDLAAFANGVMVRFLDYNDGYMSKDPGHPSDNIPACLAVAETEGRSGAELITAIVLAYEIQMRLQDASALNKRGWDHTNFILVSMAAAAARLMRLDHAATVQAINIAINGHIALRQARSGELSDWKGCSAANAARNAVFAAQLARLGLTGPAPIFEGKMGFINQVSGPLDLDVAAWGNAANGDFRILMSKLKIYPTNGELQTAVLAASRLHARIGSAAEIAKVHIDTTEIGLFITANDPEKWRPTTRETADHSLPYNVATMLVDGDLTIRSFDPAKLSNPATVALMDVTTVAATEDMTRHFPGNLPNRVTVTLTSGERLVEEVITRSGTPALPMTEAELEHKFRVMADLHLEGAAQDAVLDFARTLDRQSDFAALFAGMVATRTA